MEVDRGQLEDLWIFTASCLCGNRSDSGKISSECAVTRSEATVDFCWALALHDEPLEVLANSGPELF